jgi:hypothetical protein
LGVGALAGGLFWWFGHHTLALVVWGLAALLGGASVASGPVREALHRGFSKLGSAIGVGLSWVLLAPLFYVGFVGARVLNRLSGQDPLQLRGAEAEISFWQACDADSRKRSRPRALFATERPRVGGRRWPTAVAVLLVLAVLAEGALRLMGFGQPILYVNDPAVGYSTAPGQAVTRLGKRIEINRFGMRGPEVTAEKPAGTTRVLLLGDSTLYGGVYVDQTDTYARLLEANLATQARQPVQVLAMGVNGWGPFHELAFVEQYGTFGADVAVITLPYADIFRPLTPLSATPYLPLANPPRLALTEVLYHLSWRWRTGMAGAPPEPLRERQGHLGIATYVRLAEALRARGAEVVVQILPSDQAGTTGKRTASEALWVPRIEAAFAAAGVPVDMPDNLFNDTATHETPPGPMYKDFVHLDTAGHAVYAAFLASALPRQSARLTEVLRRTPEPFPGIPADAEHGGTP